MPTALAQTRDGYLWIGNRRGLYRFDGTHFERIDSIAGVKLPSREVSQLFAVPDGKLWIGYRNGGVSLLEDGRITNFGAAQGMPAGIVFSFAHDRQGTTWVATAEGLLRLEAGHWQRVGAGWGFPSRVAQMITLDHLGNLWVATEDRFLVLPDGGKQFVPTDEIHAGQIRAMAESPDGTVWIADLARAVRPLEHPGDEHFSGPTRAECHARYPLSWKFEPICQRPNNLEIYVGSSGLLFDRDGSFWVTTVGDGLRRAPHPDHLKRQPIDQFGDALEIFTTKEGLSADYADPILEDREGSIWIGTREGLDQFRNSTLVPVNLPNSGTAFSIAPDRDGYVWVADGSLHNYRLHDGVQKIDLHVFKAIAAYGDGDGSIWMRSLAEICQVQNDRCIGEGLPAGKKNPFWGRLKIAVDKSGTLWAYVDKAGLSYFANGKWNPFETPAELSALGPSTQFTEPTGRIWFGFTDDKIAVLENRVIRGYGAAEGLQLGRIEAIFPSAGHVWVGGEHGLALLEKNHFRAVVPADTESFAAVSGVIETQDGSLWLNESRGIVHIPASEARSLLSDPAYRPRYEVFDSLDGLPGSTPQVDDMSPAAIQGTDGRLWFATTRGVAWLDPASLPKNTLPPPVAIQSVVADGKPYSRSDHLELPAGTSKLQVGFAGLSLIVPERVKLRFQLEGIDREWQTTNAPGIASYANLSPGTYHFRAIASNNDGVWNTTGASLDFKILPAFYQTTWFYALLALTGVTLLTLLYRLRIRQVSAQVRGRLEERLAERERIARDLHDTLLQGIQGLVLRFQAATDRLSPAEPVRTMLVQALERADQVMSEGRDAVKDLRSTSGSELELAQSLSAAAEQFNQTHPAQFSASIEGAPRELHPIVREESLLIAGEALANAFQHAQAQKIEAEINYGETELRIRVRDDGRGMDEAVLSAGRPGHWGMLGMRERAKKIRATLTVWSKPGAGTEIDLRIPARVAYRARDSRPFWRRW